MPAKSIPNSALSRPRPKRPIPTASPANTSSNTKSAKPTRCERSYSKKERELKDKENEFGIMQGRVIVMEAELRKLKSAAPPTPRPAYPQPAILPEIKAVAADALVSKPGADGCAGAPSIAASSRWVGEHTLAQPAFYSLIPWFLVPVFKNEAHSSKGEWVSHSSTTTVAP